MNRREFLAALSAFSLSPGSVLLARSSGRFDAMLQAAEKGNWANLPIGERVAAVGCFFLNTPYVAHTLEINPDKESCVVNLDGLDCVTLFETSLGFARMLGSGGRSFEDLVQAVTVTRYRGGKIAGYGSRLHYTSDWMIDNDAKATVSLLTPSLPGSQEFRQRVGFMTSHPEKYVQLAKHPDLIPEIRQMEENLNHLRKYFVPLSAMRRAEERLRSGDIIGITTSVEGIDCAHTGLVIIERGTPRLLHASSSQRKVVLDERLSDVIKKMKSATGFMAVRPLEVRR